MSVVFVHGVPDTQLVWDAVVSRLDRRDVLRVSLPGFGCSVPDGFSATKEAYVDWLIGELARLPGPIDVVGHDWGALLTVRAVWMSPTLGRSWAAGGAPRDHEYVWPQAAKAWQTSGKGEQIMAMMTPQSMTAALAAAGVPPADAATAAARVDDTMKRCILSLYRSAVNVGTDWEDDLRRASTPGLVLWGDKAPCAPVRFGERPAA